MALAETVPDLEPAEGTPEEWLQSRLTEARDTVVRARSDSEVRNNSQLIHQLEAIQQTERTPEEQALWEQFAAIQSLKRGPVNADTLPPASAQLQDLETDLATVQAVEHAALELASHSPFAMVVHEAIVPIGSDLHWRILRLKKEQKKAAAADPFHF